MDQRFPLAYQIACFALTAVFILAFSIAREPRRWRHLFQKVFGKRDTLSATKNKLIDEHLKHYGIIAAMLLLVADVACFVAGVTHRYRSETQTISRDDLLNLEEQRRIQGGTTSESRRSVFP